MKALKISFYDQGLTLVELLVGIVVGLVILSAAGSVMISYVKSHDENQKIVNLNQNMRSVMDLMVRDIRRAGYVQSDIVSMDELKNNPFFENSCDLRICGDGGQSGSCIDFSYEKNGDAVVDSEESFGFRLSNGVVQMKKSGGSDCSWVSSEGISDPDIVIGSLVFDIQEKKINVTDQTKTTCAVTEDCLLIRSVIITMTGGIKGDASVPPIIQTLKSTVKIRNDKFVAKTTS